jgi:PAS domain S-box-containing protein
MGNATRSPKSLANAFRRTGECLADQTIKYRQPMDLTAQVPAQAALRWMADLATQGIMITDSDLGIISWNRWLEANTGLPASKILGQNLLEAFPDMTTRGLDSYYRDALNGQVRVLSQKLHRYLLRMPLPENLSENMEQSVRVGPLIHEGAVVGTVTVIDDVTERVEREAELISRLASERAAYAQAEEARRRVTDILESITDSYFALDRDWRFTDVNRAAEAAIFGRPKDNLIGKVFWKEYPEAINSHFHMMYRQVMEERKPAHFEGASKIVDKWFEVHTYPCENGICVYLRDITERKRAEQERERLLDRESAARREAEVASRTKDEFLSTLSHELRTPLNAIIGWAHLLLSRDLGPSETPQAVEAIRRNAQMQARLIEDMLDVSRIITGKLGLDVQRVDPAAVIAGAVETVKPAADAKEIQLEANLDSEPGYVLGDPVRLQQIVWNLLSNAVKFTPKSGRTQIELRRLPTQVTIVVRDTGPGIDPEFLPYVFDRFRQADSTSTRRYGGLGLGLAIVRHLTELHGGTVEAANRCNGTGAVFTVTLPVPELSSVTDISSERAQTPITSKSSADRSNGLAGKRIMIVDDEPDVQQLLTTVLEGCGALVVAFGSAAAAAAVLKEFRPDVLVSDIGMPGKNGYDLIKDIRALETPDGGRVPAIALTAYARAEDRLKALSAGFDIHVAKPVDPLELSEVISTLVLNRR